ncbi:CDP-alcohol phosphatidyltransferase family protein [Micromonospora sp. CPCC 206061]|uniref:CDP-alcohol phosphatidyltransferase family protein n=1 Tax=Micromonospora sp. CPCC 206061 TaxID=3122410 RepID=UPI002FEFFB8D
MVGNWDGYAVEWARLHGGFDPRRAGPAVRRWLHSAYTMGSVLARVGIPPAAVTGAGVALSASAPVLAGQSTGRLVLAAVFVLLSAVADSVDGAVAVISGRTSRLGYLYDSLADRISEACWLVAFWVVGASAPLVVLVGAVCWLHEYVRARAAAAGMREIGVVTIGERPTRVVLAVTGLLLAGASGLVQSDLPAGVITVMSAIWLTLALFGLAQLLAAVRHALR